ncbi:hypothetical protein FA95DRAFT_1610712 [Auriscalpium vulgare]|uniref:Uncharacterized protein n=1 Tax=Auriscalpium vulgare TaxID=40419 RepID=A0ACB8RCB5_9AGAM|nr:hypothetical protein FA95DRAFT_1610712 [Auriscalpium vulgare]
MAREQVRDDLVEGAPETLGNVSDAQGVSIKSPSPCHIICTPKQEQSSVHLPHIHFKELERLRPDLEAKIEQRARHERRTQLYISCLESLPPRLVPCFPTIAEVNTLPFFQEVRSLDAEDAVDQITQIALWTLWRKTESLVALIPGLPYDSDKARREALLARGLDTLDNEFWMSDAAGLGLATTHFTCVDAEGSALTLSGFDMLAHRCSAQNLAATYCAITARLVSRLLSCLSLPLTITASELDGAGYRFLCHTCPHWVLSDWRSLVNHWREDQCNGEITVLNILRTPTVHIAGEHNLSEPRAWGCSRCNAHLPLDPYYMQRQWWSRADAVRHAVVVHRIVKPVAGRDYFWNTGVSGVPPREVHLY